MKPLHLQVMFAVQAALFAGLWLVYLRRLDIFHPEKWLHLVLVFGIGLATPLIVLYAPDQLSSANMNGEYWHDFEEFFLKVGLLEEFAKIIPLALIALFTKIIDEPVDYVIYAAVLSLGFSATENVIYMNRYDHEVLASRGLISSFGHMCFSSIAVYGWVEGKYRFKKHAWFYLLWTFVMAALAHAMFDWLLSVNISIKLILFIVFYIFLLEVWALIINNSLNSSPHYSKKIVVDDEDLQWKMKIGFILNAAAQFAITLIVLQDTQKSIGVYVAAFSTAIFFFFFVSTRLTHFTLVPNKWYTLFPKVPFMVGKKTKPEGDYKRAWLVNIKGSTPNEYLVSGWIEQEVDLVPLSKQKLAINAVLKGEITDKFFLEKDEVVYLFRSYVNLPSAAHHPRLLVLKAFDGHPNLINEEFPVMALLAVPPQHDFSRSQEHNIKKFPFVQWIAIKPKGVVKIKGERVTDIS